MTRIGLVGGSSWVSTVEYYSRLNRLAQDRTGGRDFADCVVFSLNFRDIKRNNEAGDHGATARLVLAAAKALVSAGCQGLALCANGLHMFAAEVEAAVPVPLLHVGEASAQEALNRGYRCVGLVGSRFTMQGDFVSGRFADRGIRVLVPDQAAQGFIHDTIFSELTEGRFLAETRARYEAIFAGLAAEGAEAVVLACTELPMLMEGAPTVVHMIDSTRLHIDAIADFMLDGHSSANT